MSKHYGLTDKPNKEIQDKSPEWMDDMFKKLSNPRTKKKEHPFSGVDDPILNPERVGLDKK